MTSCQVQTLRLAHQRLFTTTTTTTARCALKRRFQSTVTSSIPYDDDDYDMPTLPPLQSSTPTRNSSPLYVSATRQHVGKTTTSLALLSGLQKRFKNVGFMKPVGQHSLQVKDIDGSIINVDKDAVLVKEHFGLDHLRYADTSPVLIPKGYTRDYLDGKISFQDQEQLVLSAHRNMSKTSEIILCEGTGHCAVGSIVHASNAQVARWLGAKMVLVANGGLGNTFDELELNKALCDREGVDICGVVVNKVTPEKLDQTRTYISKALELHWGDVPLLGCIPDRPFLGCAALSDLERLFKTELLTGSQHRMRHYSADSVNLVATSLQVFLKDVKKKESSRTLYVCHASRNDILLGFLLEHPFRKHTDGEPAESAMIVTGTDEYPLSEQVMDIIQGMDDDAPPVLLAPHPTSKVMGMIHGYTPKLNFEDSRRADTAVDHYEKYIDFDLLLERSGHADLQAATN